MRVENINPNINFNARLIKLNRYLPEVGHISKSTGKYNSCAVQFVEIDTSNLSDIDALYHVSKSWQYTNFSPNVYNSAYEKYSGNNYYKNYKMFAITRQKGNFDELDDSAILAVADVEETIPHIAGHLSHIQVNPEFINKIEPEYKGVGTSLLKSLQQIYKHISLRAENSFSVKNFYRKNNFVEEPRHSCCFKWSDDIFSVLGIGKDCK